MRDAVVRELTRTERGWRIVHGPTIAPTLVDADAVVLALPAAPAARLLEQACQGAARELARIEYASMAIVTVAVDARRVDVDLAGSGFLVPPVDGRLIKAATYSQPQVGLAARRRARCCAARSVATTRKPTCNATTATSSRTRSWTCVTPPVCARRCSMRW